MSDVIQNESDEDTIAPINRLPEEILERIFSFTSQYNDYINIGLVCKKWHRIIVGLIELNKNTFSSCFQTGEIEWQCITGTANVSVPSIDDAASPPSPAPLLHHPQQRHSHSCALLGHTLYIFGGLSPTSTAYNDLWALDLNTKQWSRASTSGSSCYPSPKAAATMLARSATRELLLYGGYAHSFFGMFTYNQPVNFFDEFHVFSTVENSWRAHVFAQEAPKLAGHSASFIQNYMVLFGGCNSTLGNKSNSVYCLDLDTYTWINVVNLGANPSVSSMPSNTRLIEGPKPEARYGHSQITLDAERILIVGGCGGPNKQFDDAWILHWPKAPSTSACWQRVLVRNLINAPSQHYCIPLVQCCQGGTKLITFGRVRIPSSSANSAPALIGVNNETHVMNGAFSADKTLPMTLYGAVKQPRLRICSCLNPKPTQKFAEESKPKLEASKSNDESNKPIGMRPSGNNASNGEVFLNKSQLNTVKRLEVLKKYADKICNGNGNHLPEPESTLERTKQQRRCVVHSRLMQVFILDLAACLLGELAVSWQTPIAHFSSHTPPETTLFSLACGIDEIVLFGGMETDSSVPNSMRPSSNEYVRHRVSNKVYVMKPRQLFHIDTTYHHRHQTNPAV